MGLLGDFAAGAGAVGAQLGIEQIRAITEEEKAQRLAEMSNKYATQRQERDITARREDAETKRQNDLKDAPVLAGVQTDAAVRKEREVRGLPAAPLSPEDAQVKRSQAGLADAQARRWDAETRAITDGLKYQPKGGANPGDAATERAARTAAAELGNRLRAEKGEDGAALYDSATVLQYERLAGDLVRRGYNPQEAASVARSAPLKSAAQINAQLQQEEAKLPRGGFLSGGNVEVGGKSMSLDEWRTARAAELKAQSAAELKGWMANNGLSGENRPTPEAIAALRADPSKADDFKRFYGVDPQQYLKTSGKAQRVAPEGAPGTSKSSDRVAIIQDELTAERERLAKAKQSGNADEVARTEANIAGLEREIGVVQRTAAPKAEPVAAPKAPPKEEPKAAAKPADEGIKSGANSMTSTERQSIETAKALKTAMAATQAEMRGTKDPAKLAELSKLYAQQSAKFREFQDKLKPFGIDV